MVKEIACCEAKGKRVEQDAIRFAGKAAFLKAAGTGGTGKLSLCEKEIWNGQSGRPDVTSQAHRFGLGSH